MAKRDTRGASSDVLLHRDAMSYVFSFVSQRIIPQTALAKSGSKFSFFRNADDDYNAMVASWGPASTRFNISINQGVADALYSLIRRVAGLEGSMKELGLDALRGLGMVDLDRVFNVAYCHALSFICLHEVAHVAAGHLDCYKKEFSRVSSKGLPHFNETTRFSYAGLSGLRLGAKRGASIRIPVLNRMMELEADGAASAVLYDFHCDIAAMSSQTKRGLRLFEAGRLSRAQRYALQRCYLLGELSALVLMLRAWNAHVFVGARDYPFPEARVLNVFSTFLRKTVPHAIRIKGTEIMLDRGAAGLERPLIDACRKVLIPVVWYLDAAAKAESIEVGFFRKTDNRGRSGMAGLLQDTASLMSGDFPVESRGGRELTELTKRSGPYYALLERYRRVDWWSRRKRAVTENSPP